MRAKTEIASEYLRVSATVGELVFKIDQNEKLCQRLGQSSQLMREQLTQQLESMARLQTEAELTPQSPPESKENQ